MTDQVNEAVKYRKKPVVIEAVRFDGTAACAAAICCWANADDDMRGNEDPTISYSTRGDRPGEAFDMVIWTLEGDMTASSGDWIIKGVKGEFYPCKPDIFAATYEPAAHPSRGVVDDEAAHDDIITLSDVSGVLGEIAEQFDGGEYHVSEETRRVLIDFAHGITDHPLFSIVGRHFVQSRSAWLIEHRNRGWWRGFQGGASADDIWCRDANRAIRFSRKVDAANAIDALGLSVASVFASEYTMLAATPAHDQPEGSDND